LRQLLCGRLAVLVGIQNHQAPEIPASGLHVFECFIRRSVGVAVIAPEPVYDPNLANDSAVSTFLALNNADLAVETIRKLSLAPTWPNSRLFAQVILGCRQNAKY
jgi:hypothetical protein